MNFKTLQIIHDMLVNRLKETTVIYKKAKKEYENACYDENLPKRTIAELETKKQAAYEEYNAILNALRDFEDKSWN